MTIRWQTALVTAAVLALAAASARAQPPVARPQPPPAAPGARTPAPAPAPAETARPEAPPAAASPNASAPSPSGTTPAAAADPDAAPAPEQLNAPVFPGAAYLGSYDAGRGQRFHLFGSSQSFAEIVLFYRGVLKDKGELVFEEPPTHMFDVGKFREDDVAFPPGVTVKDYAVGGSPGLPNPAPGGTPAFFPTVIQIVPPPPGLASRRAP